MTEPVTIDFETEALQERPRYPPKPVGVAIMYPGKKPRYYAWGHPSKNTSSEAEARLALLKAWAWKGGLLFHNAKFDLDVAETHLGLPLPGWERVHDTLFLLFLNDPHAPSLALKPSAERLLGMPPEERDAVAEWLAGHGVCTVKQASEFICKAPGDLVGPYACGDVVRTYKLHRKLYDGLDAGEREAYDRERRLLPILLRNEREGLCVDLERLESDLTLYTRALAKADGWLCKRLGEINLDADAEVAKALRDKRIVTEFAKTKTGRDSVAKANLTADRFTDYKVYQTLGYRNRLQTVLSMSMFPWAAQARETGGRIYTQWNQVRQAHGDEGAKGTRTGRLSCSRFMNITKDFNDKGDGYVHPRGSALPELPLVRKYILPDPGGVVLHRDYDQQEFRILAHFEEGELLQAYRADPKLDSHVDMQRRLADLGHKLDRRPAKTLGFGILYGMGQGLLAKRLGVSLEVARELIQAVKRARPGVTELDTDLKRMGRAGEAVRAWGGRRIFCKPPGMVDGQRRTYEYAMLNHLIQGSAAACTKEALIRYDATRKHSRLMVTVHDEINISADVGHFEEEMMSLKRAMESVEFDLPMLTSGKLGPTWGDLAKGGV